MAALKSRTLARFSYVLAKSRAPEIEPFAVGVERGSPTYNSISDRHRWRARSSRWADIRGKPFGSSATRPPHPATSRHAPTYLRIAGLDATKDYQPVHLGARTTPWHAQSKSGQVPAGALSKPIYDNLVAKGSIDASKIVQLDLSEPIPNYPMVMQGNLAPGLKQAIRAAFLNMKDKEVLKAFRIDGFAATDDKAYDVLRETATLLKLDLAKTK